MGNYRSHVDRVARVRITLDRIRPLIWRRVDIPLTMSLKGVHEVIQAVMLFDDHHQFDFHVEIDGVVRRYGIPDPDGLVEILDAKSTKLGMLIDHGTSEIAYCYDFGDNWQHRLVIQGVSDADPKVEYPKFVDGKRRAPPEDVGGTLGFSEFTKAMRDPDHPRHHRMVEWYGRRFDPHDIEIEAITARVKLLANRRTVGKAGFEMSKAMRH